MSQIDLVMSEIHGATAPDTNIIFGSTYNESLTGRLRVSIIVTGVDMSGDCSSIPSPPQPGGSAREPSAEPKAAPKSVFEKLMAF